MSHWKAFGLAIFAAICLLCETSGSAQAQCAMFLCATQWSGGSVTNLEGPSGSLGSVAEGVNNNGQAVGVSVSLSLNPKRSPPSECATGLTSVSRYDPWYNSPLKRA
jgi:hypothetical protein